jgi:hypothetical protein
MYCFKVSKLQLQQSWEDLGRKATHCLHRITPETQFRGRAWLIAREELTPSRTTWVITFIVFLWRRHIGCHISSYSLIER